MSDPWAVFAPVPREAAAPAVREAAPDPWASFTTVQPSPDQLGVPVPGGSPQPSKAYTGSILPFSRDAQGKARFDSDAGILGSIKSGLGLPGDVATGQVPMGLPSETPDLSRVADLAGLAIPINPAVRAGDKLVPGVTKNLQTVKPPVPTAQELQAAGSAGYDTVRDMGVQYSSDAVSKVAQALKGKLEADGIQAELAPKTHSVIARLLSPPADSVATSANIEAARRSFRRAGKGLDETEGAAARRGVKELDRFVEAADPSSVVAGPAAEAGRALGAARGNYAAGKRGETLASREDAAGLRAAAANSGANTDNSIRQRIASLLLSPRAVAGFSEAERAALTGVVEGTTTRNAARAVGNLLGGGGGLGSVVTGMSGIGAGGYALGPAGAIAGAAIPAIGIAAKQTGNALTRRALSAADEMVRMRSPLYEERLLAAPMEGAPVTQAEVIARALMQSESPDR